MSIPILKRTLLCTIRPLRPISPIFPTSPLRTPPLLTSHFLASAIAGLLNPRAIPWRVPRSHAPLNARFGCLCEDKGCTGSDGMAGRMIET